MISKRRNLEDHQKIRRIKIRKEEKKRKKEENVINTYRTDTNTIPAPYPIDTDRYLIMS